ncbi:MAG: hypothetical protein LBD13_01575, partial [Spirochaetaceae bacterium]|nr:hypothetical protein [Spirochaetaceae bacterium]
ERTPVINAQIKAAFERLQDKMREIKNRWFHKPPLTDEDFVALLLAEPDEVPSYHGRPTTHGVIKAGPHGARGGKP